MTTTKQLILLRWIVLLSIITIIILGTLLYLEFSKQNAFRMTNDPQKAKEVSRSLKETVAKIYAIPDEDPKIATVVDPGVLPNNPFYKNAKNGDKLLIFSNAQKIILYRPSENKVIDVGATVPNQTPSQDVAGAKAEIEVKAPPASDSPALKTQPKILFDSSKK